MRCQIICPGCTKKLIFSQFSWSVLGELLGVGGNLDFMIELPEVLLPDGPQVKFESAPGSTPKVIFLKEDVERAEPMPKYKGTDFISIDDYIEAMNKGAISDDETDYNFDDLMEDLDSEGNKA